MTWRQNKRSRDIGFGAIPILICLCWVIRSKRKIKLHHLNDISSNSALATNGSTGTGVSPTQQSTLEGQSTQLRTLFSNSVHPISAEEKVHTSQNNVSSLQAMGNSPQMMMMMGYMPQGSEGSPQMIMMPLMMGYMPQAMGNSPPVLD